MAHAPCVRLNDGCVVQASAYVYVYNGAPGSVPDRFTVTETERSHPHTQRRPHLLRAGREVLTLCASGWRGGRLIA